MIELDPRIKAIEKIIKGGEVRHDRIKPALERAGLSQVDSDEVSELVRVHGYLKTRWARGKLGRGIREIVDKLGSYGRISTVESQTYEDPMILAMNLFESMDDNKTYFSKNVGFSDKKIEKIFDNYRPLGACSGYIWNDIRNQKNGDIDEMLK